MSETMDKIKMRKVVLTHLSQTIKPQNVIDLQRECAVRDTTGNGQIESKEFYKALQMANIMMTDREFQELATEVDPHATGRIQYTALLSELFLTLLYIKEYWLIQTMKSYDVDKKGGLTIRQMQKMLSENQDF